MTRKQIEALRKRLNTKHYGDKCYIPSNEILPWTRKEKVLMQELEIREMINSMLIYDDDPTEGTWYHNKYLKPYYEGTDWRNQGFVTRERVNELIAEQETDFAKAEVGFAGCDSEGCSYNYCRWADEQ